ncbi:RHS repeat-associated core domain-containing protein [Pseudomonas typographi]
MPFGYFNNRGTHLGLNGDWFEHEFEGYLLGIGHRAFIPNLMRFTTADSQSPFRSGGINSYVYCLADPIRSTLQTMRGAPQSHCSRALETSLEENHPVHSSYRIIFLTAKSPISLMSWRKQPFLLAKTSHVGERPQSMQ